MRFIERSPRGGGLRYNGDDTAPGAQTVCRDDAWAGEGSCLLAWTSSAGFGNLNAIGGETMSTIIKADATGAVTVPAELCRAAGVKPGDDSVVEVEGGRVVLSPARPTLAERIAALTADAPEEELDKLPTDGAAQVDHYLYGHPKRPG